MAKKLKTKKTHEVIFILPDGSLFPDPIELDPTGKNHSSRISWQATDVTKNYELVFDSPPGPFSAGDIPILTDTSGTDLGGSTAVLTVKDGTANGSFGYSVVQKRLGRRRRLSGGSIIVDA
jgi:hypothetical protein